MKGGLRKEQTNKQEAACRLSFTTRGRVNAITTLETCLAVSSKVKYTCTNEPEIPFWGMYLRDMNTYVCLQQELCRKVFTSFTYNSPPPSKSLLQFKANPKIP